ncbi:syndecan-3 isoform X2 [Canis lupus familiaris]|uniref:syndecan-3 isoform X2 n=1 Tax=Canis lupus familiaris TaxID=9615 RepID=UPI0018F4EFF2|nr:syndecan-3 isoform X2 [Canis lupus familiaris]
MPASAMWGLSQASQPVSPGVKWGQSEQPVTALSSPGARLCWKGSQALAHLVLVVTAPEASVLSPHHRTWGHLNDTVAGRRSEQCLVNSGGSLPLRVAMCGQLQLFTQLPPPALTLALLALPLPFGSSSDPPRGGARAAEPEPRAGSASGQPPGRAASSSRPARRLGNKGARRRRHEAGAAHATGPPTGQQRDRGRRPGTAPAGCSCRRCCCWLLAGRAAGAQRWRNENFERPVDLEGSGDDDSFPDDELDDLYSGSGSGYFEQESGIETAMRFSPDVAMAVSTTAAVLPTVDIQPVGTPFEELPSEHPTPEPATSPPVVTEVPEEPSQRATTISTPTAPTAATTAGALTVATVPATVATAVPSIPAAPPSTATTSVIRTTGVRRLLPLPLTTAATARATTPAAPSPPTTVAVLDTEAPTPRMVSTATSRPRALPRPATTQEPDLPEKSTLPLGTTAPGPTEVAQTPTLESVLTTIRDEPEVPVSGGPSGDFELPEEETTQPDTANEVVAVGGAAAKPSPPPGTLPKGARPGPGLLDNAIDSGSSAAQLPQKSILERKEVLVAVIVGGVVGALFAAFLVTLLIYRMKKKDEGSYTLEEPKQASVTYQKPDKQEEFYA